MNSVGQREVLTQQRVLRYFRESLGYAWLGNWKDRPGNGNVEEELLGVWLKKQGHNEKIIGKVLQELDKAKTLSGSKTLHVLARCLMRWSVCSSSA